MKVKLFVILILLFFSGCQRTYHNHNDLAPDSPQVVAFKYKIYRPEAPEKDMLNYFEFQITLTDNFYLGDVAYIKFKSGPGYEINEEPIEFVFEDISERLMIQITPSDLSKPLELPFEGKIISNDKSEVEFFGSLLINRKHG